MLLFIDTETSGLPHRWDLPWTQVENWPRLVQLGWILTSMDAVVLNEQCHIVKPDGFRFSPGAIAVHGISDECAADSGHELSEILDSFCADLDRAQSIVAHNLEFDLNVLKAELVRDRRATSLLDLPGTCTMRESAEYCGVIGKRGWKWPSLSELHQRLFDRGFSGAHNALADCRACMGCFYELRRRGVLPGSQPVPAH